MSVAQAGLWLLLALVVATWLVTAYAGLRRNARVRIRLLQTQRQMQVLEQQLDTLRQQLRATPVGKQSEQ